MFFCDDDRRLYLKLLKHYSERHGVLILGYCLMDNHVHLILCPPSSEALSRSIASTHMRFAQAINGREAWTGHLWQERFFSSALDDEYFWIALRYVERNPVEAMIVEHAPDYPWSSARGHCDQALDMNLTTDERWIRIKSTRANWYDWLEDADAEPAIRLLRDQTRRDLPSGTPGFLESIEATLGVSMSCRPRGRPLVRDVGVAIPLDKSVQE